MRRKRQRTSWQYKVGRADGPHIHIGWIHNPSFEPKEDVVRMRSRSDDGTLVDVDMTPLEALSFAAGLMLTLSHRGWTGDLQKADFHFGELR